MHACKSISKINAGYLENISINKNVCNDSPAFFLYFWNIRDISMQGANAAQFSKRRGRLNFLWFSDISYILIENDNTDML